MTANNNNYAVLNLGRLLCLFFNPEKTIQLNNCFNNISRYAEQPFEMLYLNNLIKRCPALRGTSIAMNLSTVIIEKIRLSICFCFKSAPTIEVNQTNQKKTFSFPSGFIFHKEQEYSNIDRYNQRENLSEMFFSFSFCRMKFTNKGLRLVFLILLVQRKYTSLSGKIFHL